jgi:prepilin-type N-terminal cleavage/methylation domain-containing protein
VKDVVAQQAPGAPSPAMGRPPSSGGRIEWAQPIRPRFRSGSDEIEPRQRPWGQARQGRGGEAPELTRKGFTLVEILVSIGIFVIAATVMLGALFGATEVFRRGEAARQAGDEATSVLAALQEDLSRATPIRLREGMPAPEWGRITASVTDGAGTADGTGNCLLELVCENPDKSQVRWVTDVGGTRRLVGMRKLIIWGTSGSAPDTELVREEWDLSEDGTRVDRSGGVPANSNLPLRQDIITRGVLHFGVWLEIAQAHRMVTTGTAGPEFGWESKTAEVAPFVNEPFSTATPYGTAPNQFYALPDAIRISIVLTGGGRYATRGTLIQDNGQAMRISGIKALPTTSGSLLRIGDEWVRYRDFRGGQISGVDRAQLRSTQANHGRGALVLAGQPFSLVVALPK